MLMLLVTFGTYSQCIVKKCNCCSKPTKVVHHVKKKPIKPKPKPVVKPIAKDITAPTNITINYITDCPIVSPIVAPVVQKDTVIKIVKVIAEPIKLKPDTPEFEIYGGVVNPKEISEFGYMVGFNVLPNLHQIGKNGKEREYLNKFLFGFEFSGYKTTPLVNNNVGPNVTTSDTSVTTIIENGDETPIGDFSFSLSRGNNTYQDVKGLSLNFGVEIYRGWFLIGGVTSYKNQLKLNGNTLQTTYSTFIDAGVKKFFKLGNVYLSPTIKFNEQTSSFGVGFSYD